MAIKNFQYLILTIVAISSISIFIFLAQLIIQNNDAKISIASAILQECGRDDECVIKHLQSISKKEEQSVVLSVLDEIVLEWEDDDFYCHETAHHLGEFLLGYFDGDLEEAMSHVNNNCGNALYHGILENYLALKVLLEKQKVEELELTNICSNVGISLESNIRKQCLHGLGHSIVKIYEYDVFEASKRCDEFQTWAEQDMCLDGLFMENHVENFATGGGTFVMDDIYYPCNVLDEKYQFRCYTYQAYYILKENDFSYMESFEDCERMPSSSEELIQACIGGVSNYLTVRQFFYDIDGIAKMCNEVNPKYQDRCINIAVFALVRYVDPELGDDFCNLFQNEQIENCIKEWKRVKLISNLP